MFYIRIDCSFNEVNKVIQFINVFTVSREELFIIIVDHTNFVLG